MPNAKRKLLKEIYRVTKDKPTLGSIKKGYSEIKTAMKKKNPFSSAKTKTQSVPSPYKQGGKGPGNTTRTTRPAEVTKSYGQMQKMKPQTSTNNMVYNDPITTQMLKPMKGKK
jgi:hypothetical protein